MLDMGPIEQNIAKQAYRAGNPLPDRIKNAPVLRLGLGLYLGMFFDLDAERSHAMGLTAIPWTAIKEYAEFYSFDVDQCEDAFLIIRRMDDAHLRRLKSKQDK